MVDLGYRGVDAAVAPVQLIHRAKIKRLTKLQRRWLRRRQAVEPAIGHAKHDHGLQRCWLKSAERNALHTVLCAPGGLQPAAVAARHCSPGHRSTFFGIYSARPVAEAC